jgi:tetratricopeptide (TPR) repeat protein
VASCFWQWNIYTRGRRAVGRFDEDMAEIQRAPELDPLSPIISNTIAAVYFRSRRYDQGIAQLQKTLDMDSSFVVAKLIWNEFFALLAVCRLPLPNRFTSELLVIRREWLSCRLLGQVFARRTSEPYICNLAMADRIHQAGALGALGMVDTLSTWSHTCAPRG